MSTSNACKHGEIHQPQRVPSSLALNVATNTAFHAPASWGLPQTLVSSFNADQIWLPHFAAVILGGLSGLVFTAIVMLASYITTYFMAAFEEPSSYYSYSFFYISPIQVFQDLVTAAFRVLRDGDVAGILDDVSFTSPTRTSNSTPPTRPKQTPGLIMRFIRRFVLGLPLVGAGSLVHLLLSVQMLAPVQWLARYRGQRNRRDNSRDIAALIVIGLLVVGAARYLIETAQPAVILPLSFAEP